MNSVVNVKGLNIHHMSFLTLKKAIVEYLNDDRLSICVLVSTKLMKEAIEDQELGHSLQQADLLLPGEKQVFALESDPMDLEDVVSGYSAILELLDKMENSHTLYLLATEKRAIDRMTRYAKNHFPKLNIVGAYNQQDQWTDQQLVNAINSANPDMIVNTIPTPVEGKWITEYGLQINAKLYIGLGAIFHGMVSELKDPPMVFRKLHLSSLYNRFKQCRNNKFLHLRIFRLKIEQYNTKKGEKENGTTK